MPIPFDTHTFITDLIQAGMPEAQATVLSDTLQQVYRDTAVTKQDLALAMSQLDTRFASLDSQLEKRFASIDTRFATLEGQIAHLRYLGYAIFVATVVKFFIP
jgi:flagellar capping protein FliD